jgi:uncharacterized protein YydD (DUF2326 family)
MSTQEHKNMVEKNYLDMTDSELSQEYIRITEAIPRIYRDIGEMLYEHSKKRAMEHIHELENALVDVLHVMDDRLEISG